MVVRFGLIALSGLVLVWSARPQQAVSVTGTLNCNGKPAKDVKIKLYDKDTFTFDDLMGKTSTDASGRFEVSGTANEVTSIQPKLNVYHRCNYTPLIPTCYQKFSIRIPKDYITKGPRAAKTFDIGNINLADIPMGISVERITGMPNVVKLYALACTLIVMLSVGSASIQPAGTGWIWSISILNFVLGIIMLVILAIEMDEVVFPRRAFFSWPLLECIVSIFFAITYFISTWLSANGAGHGSVTAFSIAGLFSLIGCVAHTFNVIVFGRIWAMEQQLGPAGERIFDSSHSQYGSP